MGVGRDVAVVTYGRSVSDRRPSIFIMLGQHVGISPTKQTSFAPSAKRHEVFGESHAGWAASYKEPHVNRKSARRACVLPPLPLRPRLPSLWLDAAVTDLVIRDVNDYATRVLCLTKLTAVPSITPPHPPPPTPLADVRFTSGSWKNAIHPSCDSPNTPRRFALGASDVCLVGENPTCSVPA